MRNVSEGPVVCETTTDKSIDTVPYLLIYVVTVICQQKLMLKFHFASSAIFDP